MSYTGGCHCGKIAFEVDGTIDALADCNCTICAKHGYLHWFVGNDQLHLKTPQAKEELDELSALVKKSGPVCILCYERDHRQCHRQWIAEIIEERDGVGIKNLVAKQI